MNDPGSRPAPLVLIADNDAGVSSLLQEVLGRSGVRTAAVGDGVSALEFMRHRPVALLVCDLDMPRMGGEEVVAKLADLPNAPRAFVVSGYLDDRIEAELVATGCVARLFRKPFDVFAFAAAVVEEIGGEPIAGESAAGA